MLCVSMQLAKFLGNHHLYCVESSSTRERNVSLAAAFLELQIFQDTYSTQQQLAIFLAMDWIDPTWASARVWPSLLLLLPAT